MAKKVSVKVYKKGLLLSMNTGSNAKITKDLIRKSVGPRMIEARRKLLDEFDKHKITQELTQLNPESGANISGTLGGYGNLFSFIGFKRGYKPTEKVRQLLARPLSYSIKNVTFFGNYRVVVGIPDKDELYAAAGDIPWNPGRSWLDGIEFGISGLRDYFYKEKGYGPNSSSRSKHAYQRVGKGTLPGRFQNTKYISTLLKDLKKDISKGTKR